MRPIDADALKKANGLDDAVKYGNQTTEQRDRSYSTMMLYEIADMIDDAPTIEAEQVRHGKWSRTHTGCCKCSICGQYELYARCYCPYCGAKMDGGEANATD